MLYKRMWREIRHSPWAFVSIIFLVCLGTALFTASYISFVNLQSSSEKTYQELKFAHLTFRVQAAPNRVVEKIESLPGVEMANGRVSKDVPLDIEGDSRRVTARMLTLPSSWEDREFVNAPFLVEGAWPARTNEVLLLKSFAEYYRLQVGDYLYPIINGEQKKLIISGVVTSPEYIYPLKDRQQVLATARDFAVIYLRKEIAEKWWGMQNAFNEIVVYLERPREIQEVKKRIEKILAPYGLLSTIEREDQPSHFALKMELEGLQEMAFMFPVLFLGTAAMVIYIILARMIARERRYIGILRALGYSRKGIMVYYLSYTLAIGVLGSLLGAPVGYGLSVLMTKMYANVFDIPYLVAAPHWDVQGIGVIISVITCLAAGFNSARKAASLRPVDAMRPETPLPVRQVPWDSYLFSRQNLPVKWKIPLRNVARFPRRMISNVVGIALATSLILVGLSWLDGTEELINHHFERVINYDAKIIFDRPVLENEVLEIARWEEVMEAEPLLEMPVRFHYGSRSFESILVGIPAEGEMFRLFEDRLTRKKLTGRGILISSSLQEELKVKEGQRVEVEILGVGGDRKSIPVAGTVFMSVGSGAFLPLGKAQEITGEPGMISAVMTTLCPGGMEKLKERTKDLSPIAAIEDVEQTRQDISQYMGLLYTFIGIMIIFGMSLAGVITFNTSHINILERRPELLILRMLGMGPQEIAALITRENFLTAFLGLVVGIPLGKRIAAYFAQTYSTDLMTMPLVILPRTYWLTVGVIFLAVFLAQIPGIRYVNRLNLAEAAKEREV